MFKVKSKEAILELMLSELGRNYDPSPGYLPYDFSSANALELSNLYASLETLFKAVDVDEMSGEWLEKYVFQRKGIKRKVATKARGFLEVMVTEQMTVNVPKGALFETASGIRFQAVADQMIVSKGTIEIISVDGGELTNVLPHTITLMPMTIPHVLSVTNPLAVEGGYNAESDERLRERFYNAVRTPASSGNRFDYKRWAKEVSGVGDAYVLPTWNGANTVKVVICDAKMKPVSDVLISEVQAYIDPLSVDGVDTWGKGFGQAPLGARCTVESVVELPLTIALKVKKATGVSLATIENGICEAFEHYMSTVGMTMGTLSYAKMILLLASVEGIVDLSDLKMNGVMASLSIPQNSIPVLATIQLQEWV